MEIKSAEQITQVPDSAAIICTYFSGEDIHPKIAAQLRTLNFTGFDESEKRGELKGGLYKPAYFRGSPSLLLVGLGKRQDFAPIRWLRAVGMATRFLTRRGYDEVAVVLPSYLDTEVATRTCLQGVVLGAYDEGLFKTVDRPTYSLNTVIVVGERIDTDVARRSQIVAESANTARELLNLPPNDLTPTILADRAVAVGDEADVEVGILDAAAIAELGMGAILAVAKGSAEPPRVINMRYGDENAKTKLAIVGKGLTFDSGGLSLKPAEGMEWMKGDMGGAAAVIGAMRAIGLLKPEGIHVRGLVGSVENMPGPSAMKPGDVLRTLNGKTIEVLNTDAEGRLVLSDMLEYASQLGATHIVDLATLTGAAVVALGHEAAAVMGRPQRWIDVVLTSADRANERLWQLPLYPEYRSRIKSDIADMKNIGGRWGGAETAAALLSEFVADVPWAHLDIAGTAWADTSNEYEASGGTGYGVATLVELTYELANGSSGA